MSFVIDLDGLTDLLGDLSAFDARLAERIEALDDEMARLHSQWSGTSASAQLEAHQRLTQGLSSLRLGLAEMQRAGAVAHGNYCAAVQTNLAMLEGLG